MNYNSKMRQVQNQLYDLYQSDLISDYMYEAVHKKEYKQKKTMREKIDFIFAFVDDMMEYNLQMQ